MSELTPSERLDAYCQELEQALAREDWDTLTRLDQQVQGTVHEAESGGIALDEQVVSRLKTFYPVMIEACREERGRIEARLKQLRASKSPLQAYKAVAMTKVRGT